jgi:hypothetical protein
MYKLVNIKLNETLNKLFVMLLCLLTEFAHALPNLEFEYLGGGQDASSTLTLDGDFYQAKENQDSYNWSIDGGRSKSLSTSSTPGTPSTSATTITDTTTDVGVGVGYKSNSLVTVDGSFDYDTTPEEALADHGVTLNLGKTWLFNNEKPDEFQPRFNIKLTAGQMTYLETFSTTRVRRKKGALPLPVKGSNSIQQYFVGGSTYVKPVDWFRTKIEYKNYSYSKDVNSFLEYLDSQNRRAIGLNNAVSGFSENDLMIEFDFFYGDWELDLSKDWTRIAADTSMSTTYKGVIYRDIGEKWRVGLGAEEIESTSPSDPSSEDEAYLSASYEF